MKSKNKRILTIIITVLVLVGIACNLPISSVPANQPGAVYTQAAETIMAQLHTLKLKPL